MHISRLPIFVSLVGLSCFNTGVYGQVEACQFGGFKPFDPVNFQVVRDYQPVPGTAQTTFSEVGSSAPVINDHGLVAFRVVELTTPTTGQAVGREAIWTYHSGSQQLSRIVRAGDAAPNRLTGETVPGYFATLSYYPALTNDNVILFTAVLVDAQDQQINTGIFMAGPAGLKTLVLQSDSAAVDNPTFPSTFGVFLRHVFGNNVDEEIVAGGGGYALLHTTPSGVSGVADIRGAWYAPSYSAPLQQIASVRLSGGVSVGSGIVPATIERCEINSSGTCFVMGFAFTGIETGVNFVSSNNRDIRFSALTPALPEAGNRTASLESFVPTDLVCPSYLVNGSTFRPELGYFREEMHGSTIVSGTAVCRPTFNEHPPINPYEPVRGSTTLSRDFGAINVNAAGDMIFFASTTDSNSNTFSGFYRAYFHPEVECAVSVEDLFDRLNDGTGHIPNSSTRNGLAIGERCGNLTFPWAGSVDLYTGGTLAGSQIMLGRATAARSSTFGFRSLGTWPPLPRTIDLFGPTGVSAPANLERIELDPITGSGVSRRSSLATRCGAGRISKNGFVLTRSNYQSVDNTTNGFAVSVIELLKIPALTDYNGDGTLDPDDLADAIIAFFGSEPIDFNGDGEVNPDDLADYISEYFMETACGS